ncbi:MAG: zinc-ribbon domain-containing protein [Clostridia bacterium]|nr:zinc-ribbon domain-containing protein [Clostridia bacterium]
MGLFSMIKRQLLKVIEWTGDCRETIAYRFVVPDRYAIMNKSQLTVREGQMAIFVQEGKVADVFGPGRYKLDDIKNVPILTALMSWKYAFETPYTGEVYFISTTQFTSQKWGTTNPVMMRDAEFGMIRIRAFGIYTFRVVEPAKFLRELLGTKSNFKTSDIVEQFKRLLITKLSDVIATSKIPALDLAANYNELSEMVQKSASVDFENYGIELSSLHIENISLPEEVEKTMDTRTSLGVLQGNMGAFTQYQAAQAIRDAAKNEGGGIAGAGVGLGAGVAMGKMFSDAMNSDAKVTNNNAGDSKGGFCSNCGAALPSDAKFCAGCGAKVSAGNVCECGAKLPAGAAFCPNCGKKK